MPVRQAALFEAICAALGATPLSAASASVCAFPQAQATAAGHVLLVEDEPVNAEVALGYLELIGCSSAWVRSGAEAVARTAAERFDLVLMDLSMPELDGYATTALIRQRDATGHRVPIIALSAHDVATYRDACLHAGMDDMLSKPYTLEECAQLVLRWVGAVPARAGAASAAAPAMTLVQAVTPAASAATAAPGAVGISRQVAVSAASPAAAVAPRRADLSRVDPEAVAALRTLRSGGSELYPRLVDLFLQSAAATLAQLHAAMAADDLAAAAAACHKLTASAANVGALAFSKELRRLEQLCAGGDGAQAHPLHGQLQAAYPALAAELEGLKLRASA